MATKKEKEAMAKSLGTGGANRAAKAMLGRQKQLSSAEEAAEMGHTSAQHAKMKDATAGATQDYQMQQAIEMVRKKKSAKRTDYQ